MNDHKPEKRQLPMEYRMENGLSERVGCLTCKPERLKGRKCQLIRFQGSSLPPKRNHALISGDPIPKEASAPVSSVGDGIGGFEVLRIS